MIDNTNNNFGRGNQPGRNMPINFIQDILKSWEVNFVNESSHDPRCYSPNIIWLSKRNGKPGRNDGPTDPDRSGSICN
jgi:hypothetical protein